MNLNNPCLVLVLAYKYVILLIPSKYSTNKIYTGIVVEMMI